METPHLTSLSESALLRAVLSETADALLILDGDGQPIATSAAYDRTFGGPDQATTLEDGSGRRLQPEERPDRRAAMGESFTTCLVLVAPDGARRWFEAEARPIELDRAGIGTMVVIRDITDRVLREQQDEFMSIASHELRTPLTVLLGYLEMLQRRVMRLDDETLVRYARRAMSQTKRLAELISSLLDVTRLEHGKMVLALHPVDLVGLVEQTTEVARQLTQGQRIELAADPGPIIVNAEPGRLEQVVMNLLTNAIKYAPQTDRIDVRITVDDREVCLQVQDYGPGISPAELPNLFSRFYQVERGRRRASGLGLGLFISHEIVAAHGGTIEVASVEGAGATFSVRLPLAAEGAQR